MAVYKTVDPDESPDRVKGYAGVDPEYQNRLGAAFEGTDEAPDEPALGGEGVEAIAPKAPEVPKS